MPSGGAIKVLYDNCSYIKSKGHLIDVYVPETADESFLSLEDIVDNYYRYPVKKSSLRKFIFKLAGIIPKFKIAEETPLRIRFSDFKKVQKQIADDINGKDYDIVFFRSRLYLYVSSCFINVSEKANGILLPTTF